nr:hypothetical protein [Kibdelosporangium sp. MJ126-NF4]CTQ95407.1 hypothetical protein [Kibdelosporangium sp. MJ126-NF4]
MADWAVLARMPRVLLPSACEAAGPLAVLIVHEDRPAYPDGRTW